MLKRNIFRVICFYLLFAITLFGFGCFIHELFYIHNYIMVEPGIPEEQIIESEDYTLEIVGITFEDGEDIPGVNDNIYDRYVIKYRFINNTDEHFWVPELEIIREYEIYGDWYSAMADGPSESGLIDYVGIESGVSRERSTFVGTIAKRDPETNVLNNSDRIWKGKYRLLQKIGEKQYIAAYFTIE